MYQLVAIVGVRAFGIGRSVARYEERLVTHRAAFQVVDALRLRLWRAIAARGAGSRRLLEGGAPLDYLVTLADDLRDQLPRIIPPIGAGILVIAGTVATTAAVMPRLTLLVSVMLVASVLVATLLAVRAFSETKGKRKPVSHMAKAVRGEVARALLEAKKAPEGSEGAAAIAEAAGFAVELSPGYLDVIVGG